MTGMDDLANWLRAQWDDDEQTIRDADTIGAQASAISHDQLLDDIAAKRRILDCFTDPTGEIVGRITSGRWEISAEHVVRLLALPMAGRDGYQESWRP